MNTITSLDQLTEKYGVRAVEVDPKAMDLVHRMATSDDAVSRAAVQALVNAFDFASLSLTVGELAVPTVFRRLVVTNWKEVAENVVADVVKFGWCCWQKHDIDRDCASDPTWRAANEEDVASGNTLRKFTVPIIVPYGLYKVCRVREGGTHTDTLASLAC